MAARERFDESRNASDTSGLSARERIRRRRALTDEILAKYRAENQHVLSASPRSPLAPRSPSHRISKIQSPSRSNSPSGLAKVAQTIPESAQDQSHEIAVPGVGSHIAIQPPLNQQRISNLRVSPPDKSPLQQAHLPDIISSSTSKSPSVIPERLPYQIQEEPSRLEAEPLEIDIQQVVPLPVRNPQSVPHTPVTPSNLSVHKEVSLSPREHTLDICNLKQGVYLVPLSMSPRIREQYCATIRYHAKSIHRFMEEEHCETETVEQINVLLDEVSKVTTHIDLQGSGPSSQENVSPKLEAEYAEVCSEKFVFLGSLLEQAIRDGKFSLVIVARPGALQGILRTYLEAKRVRYIRPSANQADWSSNRQGHGEVTLLATGDRLTAKCTWVADVVIAFDETFREDEFTFANRRDVSHAGKRPPPPIVRLAVYASLGHIDLCLPRTLNPIERLRRLVLTLIQTQKRVGALRFGEILTSRCAEEVFKFVRNSVPIDQANPWPILPVRPIEGILFMESDSSLSDARSDISDECKPAGPIRYWPNPVPPKIKLDEDMSAKRAFDLEWGDSMTTQAKKQKMVQDYNAGYVEPDAMTTPVSNRVAILTSTQTQETPENLMKWLEEAGWRIATVEAELEKKTSLANDLQRWAGIRQHEYEKLRKEHGDLQISFTENADLLAERTVKIDKLKGQLASMHDAYGKLQKEALDFQARVQQGSNPEMAAAASELVRLRTLEEENAGLHKRMASLSKDFEFTRQQYQQASTAAAEASTQLQSVQPELESLRRKCAVQMTEFRRIRDEDVNREIRKEVQRLKETVKQRDAFIFKLEGEKNAELKRERGGMQTRGSSVQPKSPHGGSRGVSPAAGLLGPEGQMMGHAMVRGGSGRSSRFQN
ncbi:MAG: hypothetical protein Q9163_001164 [Psora crenata]